MVFDWSIYPTFRLRNGDSIINFETVTIPAFKFHPKAPSSQRSIQFSQIINLTAKNFDALFILAQLRSFPWFEIII